MPKDSTIQDLETLLGKCKAARSRFEPTWYTNLAYYSGNQWLYWNRGRLYEPKLDPWRVTFTDNRLIGIVRTEVAKMTKQRPVFVATPSTGGEDDIMAAQLSERILNFLWRELNLTRKQRAALMWSRVAGAGFWKVYWDNTLGEERDVLLGPDGQVVSGQDGRPMDPAIVSQLPPEAAGQLTPKTVAQGDVCLEVRSPFDIFPDPLGLEEGISSCEFLFDQAVHSQDYVKKRYGVELPEDAEAISGLAESRLGPMSGMDGGSTYRGVRVTEYWTKGKYVVWAGKKLLKEEKNPYGQLPYVMFGGIAVPGRFWPTSTVEQLRGVQTEFNKTRSQIRENASRLGNPSLLKSRMSNVNYSGIPGEEVEYDDVTQNSAPSFLQPPSMPPYVIEELDRMEVSFREISGQHEITSGNVPPGVTAASAINLLQEQDDTRLGPEIAEMENSIAEAGEMVLSLVARYYDDTRTIRIGGEDGDWDIFDFRGAMLRDSTRVTVQAGSAIPLSKAAKQAAMQQVLTLFIQNGVPVSPRQLSRFLQDMEVGGFERLIEQMTSDESQVNSEHRRMAQGMQLVINPYDDDAAHIELHQDFQKSIRYQRLQPPVQQIIEQHVELHQQRQAQQQQQQQDQQIQAQAQLAEAQAAAQAKYQPKPQQKAA